ncbi:helix-turn-helix transcriptional regulator [Roseibium sp. MMSF_3412]|uniref:ArsR/SmtB family transcription factor n=1 Tax=Roseibium sp. MMSF_3412 TaxID=3046712 RepID=UPI00273D850C|nr:helix-turn-helix domain-containing protein [Roseibium sp. MMSF_3412]
MKQSEAISALAALAQEDRLAAFRLLVSEGPHGLPSGTIAEKLDIQPTRMSFHLTTLERAGLLAAHREGRHIRYAVDYAQMKGLLAFLMEDCCANNPAICGLEDLKPPHSTSL